MRTVLHRNRGHCMHTWSLTYFMYISVTYERLKGDVFQINVKIYSESIGGADYPHTCTHLLLNKQFMTLSCKDEYTEYPF